MRYLPHTEDDIALMLEAIGATDLDELFAMIPPQCRKDGELRIPGPLTEWELERTAQELAETMGAGRDYVVFLGAGSYEHFIPATIRYLLGRSEFTTSYTPYQPEISQGTLQAVYEYQTLVSRLLGMEIANASLYDGASALAEALLASVRITRHDRVAVSQALHPHYRQVAETYLQSTGFEVVELPFDGDGRTDLSRISGEKGFAAVAIQSPNFFGCIEDLQRAANLSHDTGALLVVSFSEPLAYGLLKNPGSCGADIACGEGQSFGVPQSFGGPGLGIFATRMAHVRNMPGRLVGRTRDLDGNRGFTLTLATREQHIRREKATSNICTNNSLCAVAAAMYMASLGGNGLRSLASMNRDKAEYLKRELASAGFSPRFSAPTFNEFVVQAPSGFHQAYERLLEKKIVAGLPLAGYYPELDDCYLLCATETKSKADMDALVREIRS
ncbi:MAG: aminomethyl-transferring glycine dehydrogenase subunit GcvPA [Thermodesulfobacteriota bacterium]